MPDSIAPTRINRQIAGSGSDTALIDSITPDSPRVSSLGSIVTDVLEYITADATLFVDLFGGIVKVGTNLAVDYGAWGGSSKGKIQWTPAVYSGRTLGPWVSASPTGSLSDFVDGSVTAPTPGTSAIGAALADAVRASNPNFTVGGFVDAIDRAYQNSNQDTVDAEGASILIDQVTETVTLFTALFGAVPTPSGTVVATFTATAPTGGSGTRPWAE